MNSDTDMDMEMDVDKDKNKNKRPSDTTASSPTSKRNKSQDLKSSAQDKFKGSKEAFHLTWRSVLEVLEVFRLQKDPKIDQWDDYTKSFYFKTLNLYNSYPKEQEEKKEQTDSEESEEEQTTSEESEEEQTSSEKDEDADSIPLLFEDLPSESDEEFMSRSMIEGPFDFGFYAEGKEPKFIPYHLYLLVKEAADIMKAPKSLNSKDLENLDLVERKILFFWNYFHCHLPTNWEYSRESVIDFVENNSSMFHPGYNMVSYTPLSTTEGFDIHEYEEDSNLSRVDMIHIMSIIYSRKTPAYWKMNPTYVLFYCQACSCFGIDYNHLETASDDDVSLMNVLKIE